MRLANAVSRNEWSKNKKINALKITSTGAASYKLHKSTDKRQGLIPNLLIMAKSNMTINYTKTDELMVFSLICNQYMSISAKLT